MIRYRYVASSLENLTCASWWKSKECWCTCLYTNPWLENMTENCWKQPVNYGRDIRELIKGNQTDDWKVYINGSLYKRTLQTWRGIGIACERERPAITQFPKLLSLGSSVSWCKGPYRNLRTSTIWKYIDADFEVKVLFIAAGLINVRFVNPGK